RRSSAPWCRRSCSRAARPSPSRSGGGWRRSGGRGPSPARARPCAEYREPVPALQRNRGAERAPGRRRRRGGRGAGDGRARGRGRLPRRPRRRRDRGRPARADLRLGIQKFAWGKLDGVPPTDVVNPRDFHDPLVEDFEERKIGIPALAGTYYPPDLPRLDLAELRATLVYVPLAVPPRLALREERWFPASTVPPSAVVIPPAVASNALGMPLPG